MEVRNQKLSGMTHTLVNDVIEIANDLYLSAKARYDKKSNILWVEVQHISQDENSHSLLYSALLAAILAYLDERNVLVNIMVPPVEYSCFYPVQPWIDARVRLFSHPHVSITRDFYVFAKSIYAHVITSYPWRDAQRMLHSIQTPKDEMLAVATGNVDFILQDLYEMLSPGAAKVVVTKVLKELQRPSVTLLEVYETVYYMCCRGDLECALYDLFHQLFVCTPTIPQKMDSS